MEIEVHLRRPHHKQRLFIESPAKRKVIRAGRRGGKTTGIAIYAAQMFLQGRRVLYATPTADQIERFWFEVTQAFDAAIEAKVLYKNETKHVIEVPHTENRIRAKTAWNADTLRGDYADVLIFDEWQLMNEDAWGLVGAPMLLDNNGDAVFIYTPPSLRTHSAIKAQDPMHAAKLFKRAQADISGRYAAFHFTSHDNPYLSADALAEIAQDMSDIAYRQEIEAEDIEDAPGALWTRDCIDRVFEYPELTTIVVAVDPSGSQTGDACGIIVAGKAKIGALWHLYVLEDATVQGGSEIWSREVVAAYNRWQANLVVAERNFGGDMVETVIKHALDTDNKPIGLNIPVKLTEASRGKQIRAEPIAQLYKQGQGHHTKDFSLLNDELCQWIPGGKSPNRLDALVWAGTELLLGYGSGGSVGRVSDRRTVTAQPAHPPYLALRYTGNKSFPLTIGKASYMISEGWQRSVDAVLARQVVNQFPDFFEVVG